MTALAPILTPHGHLLLDRVEDAPVLPPELASRLQEAFARGHGHGLLQLGAGEVKSEMPAVFSYWREFGSRYVTAVCTLPDLNELGALPDVPPIPNEELESLAAAAPPMTGAEYLTATVLQSLWEALDAAFRVELSASKVSVQDFLKWKSPAWNLVGRVHFNLAENRKDDQAPFAFLATYTTRLSAHAKAQHVPLGRALSEYAGRTNKSRLLSLLLPVQRAAEQCLWLKSMVEAGEIYHPLRWTPAEALQLLTDLPRLEAAGVVVRVPGAWRANRPPRPQVSATVGAKAPSGLGSDALLDFRMEVTLDGEPLTEAEISKLLAASDGLHLVRGRWVEVDRDKLSRMLDQFRAAGRPRREVQQLRVRRGGTGMPGGRHVDGESLAIADPVPGCVADGEPGIRPGHPVELRRVSRVGHDVPRAAPVDAIGQVGGSQCRGSRQDHGADLHDREHGFPEFDLVVQHEHDTIAAADAVRREQRRYLVGTTSHVAEREPGLRIVLLHDPQRGPVVVPRVGVEPVDGPVEPVPELRPGEFADRRDVIVPQVLQEVPGLPVDFGAAGTHAEFLP